MKATLLLLLAALCVPVNLAMACIGPCYLPGCPATTFVVCDAGNGEVNVTISNNGASVRTTVPSGSTAYVGGFGIKIHPHVANWGAVSNCEDVGGSCL